MSGLLFSMRGHFKDIAHEPAFFIKIKMFREAIFEIPELPKKLKPPMLKLFCGDFLHDREFDFSECFVEEDAFFFDFFLQLPSYLSTCQHLLLEFRVSSFMFQLSS